MIDFEVKYFILIYKLPKYIKFDMFMFWMYVYYIKFSQVSLMCNIYVIHLIVFLNVFLSCKLSCFSLWTVLISALKIVNKLNLNWNENYVHVTCYFDL